MPCQMGELPSTRRAEGAGKVSGVKLQDLYAALPLQGAGWLAMARQTQPQRRFPKLRASTLNGKPGDSQPDWRCVDTRREPRAPPQPCRAGAALLPAEALEDPQHFCQGACPPPPRPGLPRAEKPPLCLYLAGGGKGGCCARTGSSGAAPPVVLEEAAERPGGQELSAPGSRGKMARGLLSAGDGQRPPGERCSGLPRCSRPRWPRAP